MGLSKLELTSWYPIVPVCTLVLVLTVANGYSAPPLKATDGSISVNQTSVEAASPQAPPPIKSILIVGDSHVMGHFGRRLVAEIQGRFQTASIVLIGVCGTSELGVLNGVSTRCGLLIRNAKGRVIIPRACRRNKCKGKTPEECKKLVCRPKKLRHYLRRYRPDLTLVQLGSNSTWLGRRKSGWQRNRRILNRFAALLKRYDTKCIFITPPDNLLHSAAYNDEFSTIYQDELQGSCGVFNSRPSQRPYLDYRSLVQEMSKRGRRHDKTHYGHFGARGREVQGRWAEEIADFTSQYLSNDAVGLDKEYVPEPKTVESTKPSMNLERIWQTLTRLLNDSG